MILSAIGLPVPGASTTSFPPPVADRAEGTVQAVTPASAAGGSSSASGSDSRAGYGQQADSRATGGRAGVPRDLEVSARRAKSADEGAIDAGRGRLGGPDRPAGPQPAFEIAVLEKLREDVMRIPPEARASAPAGTAEGTRTLVLPRPIEAPAPRDTRGTESRAPAGRPTEAPSNTRPGLERTREDAAVTPQGEADEVEAVTTEPASKDRREARDVRETGESRPREPADEGFDDARRMSGDPVPRSLDLTR